MKTACGWMLGLVGAACSAALGQGQFSQGSVHYAFSWVEYDVTTVLPVPNPNGVLEPGEGAAVRMQMSYQPAYGTAVTFATSLLFGSSGAGTIGGFWNGMLNVSGTGDAEGTWRLTAGQVNVWGLIPPFRTGGGHGTPSANGSVVENIQPAQFGASVETLTTSNGVHVWRGLWMPSSYASRTVVFSGGPSSLPGSNASLWATDNLYTVTGFDLPVVGGVPATFGSVEIPIVPAPAPAAVMVVGAGALAARRRRAP